MEPKRAFDGGDGLICETSPSLWSSLHLIRPARFSITGVLSCSDVDVPPDFPGILVRRGDRVLGVVGFGKEPDGSVSVTPPVLTPDAGWMDHQAVVTLLYDAVQTEARKLGAYGVHCLLPVPSVPVSSESGPSEPNLISVSTDGVEGDARFSTAELMQQTGLASVATVVRMQKDLLPLRQTRELMRATFRDAAEVPDGGEDSYTAHFVAAKDSVSQELETLLDVILRFSDDLPAEIRPTGARLLRTWSGRGDQLLLIRHTSGIAGIAALSGLTEGAAVLEYIGVSPQHRRRGIGSRMLHLIEHQLVSGSGDHSDRMLVLAAYADATNEPAVSLYRAAGYRQAEQYQLYYRHLSLSGNESLQFEQKKQTE